jgi:hypothetical protein
MHTPKFKLMTTQTTICLRLAGLLAIYALCIAAPSMGRDAN